METIHVKKQGETMVFFPAKDEGSERLELEVTLAPGKDGPPPHNHLVSDEKFEVISGSMICHINGKKIVLEAGESVIVKAGQVHTFKNGSKKEPLVVKGFIEPALNFRWMIRELAKSANERGGTWKDVSLLKAGYIFFQIRKEYRLGGIPFFLQTILFGLLAGISRLTGHSKSVAPLIKPDR